MPTGPQGEKRPVSSVSCAVMVGRIATGEIAETSAEDLRRELEPAAGEEAPSKSK